MLSTCKGRDIRREKVLQSLSRWRFKVFIVLGRKLFQFLSPVEIQTFIETPPDTHEDCLLHAVVAGKHSARRGCLCPFPCCCRSASPCCRSGGCELLPQLLHGQVPAVRSGRRSGKGNRAWKGGDAREEGQQKLALNLFQFNMDFIFSASTGKFIRSEL